MRPSHAPPTQPRCPRARRLSRDARRLSTRQLSRCTRPTLPRPSTQNLVCGASNTAHSSRNIWPESVGVSAGGATRQRDGTRRGTRCQMQRARPPSVPSSPGSEPPPRRFIQRASGDGWRHRAPHPTCAAPATSPSTRCAPAARPAPAPPSPPPARVSFETRRVSGIGHAPTAMAAMLRRMPPSKGWIGGGRTGCNQVCPDAQANAAPVSGSGGVSLEARDPCGALRQPSKGWIGGGRSKGWIGGGRSKGWIAASEHTRLKFRGSGGAERRENTLRRDPRKELASTCT
jgi:hypothetical protein